MVKKDHYDQIDNSNNQYAKLKKFRICNQCYRPPSQPESKKLSCFFPAPTSGLHFLGVSIPAPASDPAHPVARKNFLPEHLPQYGLGHGRGYDCPAPQYSSFDGHSACRSLRLRTNPASASDMDGLCILQVVKTIRTFFPKVQLIGRNGMTRGCNRSVCASTHDPPA